MPSHSVQSLMRSALALLSDGLPRTLSRGLLVAALTGLSGCGLWSPADDAGDESAPPPAQVETGTRGADSQAEDPSLTGRSGPQDSEQPGSNDSSQTPGASSDTLTVDERIDRLVDGQERLTQQIADLAIAVAGRNSGIISDLTSQSGEADGEGGQSARELGLGASGEVLGQAGQQVQSFGVGVVWSVIVVIIFNLLIRGVVWGLNQLSEQSVKRRLFFKRLVPIIRIVLWIFAAYLIVSVIFQVDRQGLFAAATAIGVAIGFAAQDLLKNLFGGLILVFDQPFQVGDKISVSGTYGEVVSIGLRSTRIVTADDNLVTIPNSQLVDQQVANANAGELNCQVVTDLYLPGFVDEAVAKRIAFEAASTSRFVYLNKPIVVLVNDEFKETFLTRISVKAYVLDPRFEFMLQSDVTERARAGFRKAGLTTPSQVVHGIVAVEAPE